jgi:predicted dinucleotide-binding enzyme
MSKSAGVLGSGVVGQTLAKGLSGIGYDVAIGSRNGKVIEGWKGKVGTFADVAKDSDLIILCVKGAAAKEVINTVKEHLTGKIVIDTTNPISSDPPVDGVLNFFTSLDNSLMEQLQEQAPEANFVKAFNIVGGPRDCACCQGNRAFMYFMVHSRQAEQPMDSRI